MRFPFIHILTPSLDFCSSLPHSDQFKVSTRHPPHCVHSYFCAFIHKIPFSSQLLKDLSTFCDIFPIHRRKQEIKYIITICMHLPTALIDINVWSYLLWSLQLYFCFWRKKVLLQNTSPLLSVFHLFLLFSKHFFIEYLLHPEAVPGCEKVERINQAALSFKVQHTKTSSCLNPIFPH